MPPPYEVKRQKDSNSCGYHSLANGINKLNGHTVTTAETLIGTLGAGSTVQRIADSQFNSVLAASGLPYRLTQPMSDGKPAPFRQALREHGPDAVFIAKLKVLIYHEQSGKSETDYHTAVITDYAKNPDDPAKDTWNVLCSTCAATKVITGENFTYETGAGSKGVLNKTLVFTVEGCQKLEEVAAPGGCAEKSSGGGFFRDLFSCCPCFGKPAED